MNSTKCILAVLVYLALYTTAVAQEPQLSAPSRDAASQEVTIIIQQKQLRFAAPAQAQELRLEVFNKAGESVYDSGLVMGAELFWNLHHRSGEAVPSGLYAYTLTIKEADSETPATRRGHLIVERGRDREPQTDRLWVTSQSSVGAEAAISGGELSVSSGPETNVVGTRIGRASAARTPLNLDFFGTPGQIPMFIGGDFLADSVISQDFNGRIGIGTQRPGTALLTVAGQIETTAEGIKFPNGTVQTSAGLSQVIRNASLTGNGTQNSPLGVNIPALNLLSAVAHDATLTGDGATTSPLGIANGGVTGAKIASGQVVKSLNGLFDNVNLSAGANITIAPSGNVMSIAAPNVLSSVAHNATLAGNGTSASPLGLANGGVTGANIASGHVVKSLNGQFDNVSLTAGANITITPSGNSLNIAAPNLLGAVERNGTLTGNGTGASPLGVAVPLSLSGSSSGPALEIINALGTGIRVSGGANGRLNEGAGVRAFGGTGNAGGTGVFATGGDSHSNSEGGVGIFAVGGASDGAGGGRGILATGGLSAGGSQAPAGEFTGDVHIFGTLSKSAGSFRIDHPLDPANKYLSHSFVESPDMKNIYDGNVTTDQDGKATVSLPDYFESLNRDFRYQLTVIGQFAQAIVASEIIDNRFTIRTDRPGVKVSWQVTGIRQDAYANKHRIPVEEEKPERERGYYLFPELFNQPEEKSIQWERNPEMMRWIKIRRQEAEIRRQGRENDR